MTGSLRRVYLCNGLCVTADRLPQFPLCHIIGELQHVQDEGHKVTALAVYDHAMTTEEWEAATPTIRMLIIGDARKIKCTRCTRYGRWEIGKAAMTALNQRQAAGQQAHA